jgi:hypothetical protein
LSLRKILEGLAFKIPLKVIILEEGDSVTFYVSQYCDRRIPEDTVSLSAPASRSKGQEGPLAVSVAFEITT